jgi:glycosyltransferase involved in cell wall biosynthesis
MKSDNIDSLVTVYIPTFNRQNLLERALKSVINQTHNNIEIIVIDDNSTDKTSDYMSKVCHEFEFIKYIRNEKNFGACYNRNLAIQHAKGDFITGLDDDDFFEPNRIEDFLVYWFYKKKENEVALYANQIVISPSGKKNKVSYPIVTSFSDLIYKNTVGNQIFTLTSFIRQNGGFDNNLRSWQDLDCWMSMLSKNSNFKFRNINKYSYVFDKSHEHERISQGSVDKHLASSKYIKEKYELNFIQSIKLDFQAYKYDVFSFNFFKLITLSFLSCDIRVFFRLVKDYCKRDVM